MSGFRCCALAVFGAKLIAAKPTASSSPSMQYLVFVLILWFFLSAVGPQTKRHFCCCFPTTFTTSHLCGRAVLPIFKKILLMPIRLFAPRCCLHTCKSIADPSLLRKHLSGAKFQQGGRRPTQRTVFTRLR